MITCMRARKSSNFGLIGPSTAELAALERLKKCFGVGVSCRDLYSFVVYLYVNGSGLITSVEEERANLSAVVYL